MKIGALLGLASIPLRCDCFYLTLNEFKILTVTLVLPVYAATPCSGIDSPLAYPLTRRKDFPSSQGMYTP